MSELNTGFQSLPAEYQRVLRLAQEQHQISVSSLEILVGGWSGAMVFLVSILFQETERVEHYILKLDRKSRNTRSDEVTRHSVVMNKTTPQFASAHIAQHEEDYERAESQFRKSLVMFRRLGNRRGMAECMAGLAGLKARQGNPQWGAVMLSATEAVLKATGGAWWPADRIEVDANRAIIQSALSDEELTTAQKKGKQ